MRAALPHNVTDYWSLPDGIWVHVPYFGFGDCGCPTPPEGHHGLEFTHLPRADEVIVASEALTRWTLECAANQGGVDDD